MERDKLDEILEKINYSFMLLDESIDMLEESLQDMYETEKQNKEYLRRIREA